MQILHRREIRDICLSESGLFCVTRGFPVPFIFPANGTGSSFLARSVHFNPFLSPPQRFSPCGSPGISELPESGVLKLGPPVRAAGRSPALSGFQDSLDLKMGDGHCTSHSPGAVAGCPLSLSLSTEFPSEWPGDHSADVVAGRVLGRGGEVPGGRGQMMTDRRPDLKEKPRRSLDLSLEP